LSVDFAREIEVATRLAHEAGEILLEVYETDFEVIDKPEGGGPVTIADERANELIVSGLRAAFPTDGIVAEESIDNSDPARVERCWFVDPLDGTKEFVQHTGDFAVHIGLAVGGEAVAGVVYQPVQDRLFAGIIGVGCELIEAGARRPLHLPSAPADPLRLVVSRAHRSPRVLEISERLSIEEVEHRGSVGLKCGIVALGEADLYVHASRLSYRWDACAPEAIVRAAGGFFGSMAGQPYRYDGDELQNVRGILACHPAALPRVLPVIEAVARDAGRPLR